MITMSASQTRPRRQFGSGLLSCPSWCEPELHDVDNYPIHLSGWRFWQAPNSPRFEFQIMRCDERVSNSDEVVIGQVDFNVRMEPNGGAWNTDGYLGCLHIRQFGQFLMQLAEEVDPHDLNGEPLEWHTPDRQPLLGV